MSAPQNICAVSDCEVFDRCPFGEKMLPKIDFDQPFRVVSDIEKCLWPRPLPPGDGQPTPVKQAA
jgi:hypothetical protein